MGKGDGVVTCKGGKNGIQLQRVLPLVRGAVQRHSAALASAMAGGGWIWELSCVRSAVCFCFVCVFICHFL